MSLEGLNKEIKDEGRKEARVAGWWMVASLVGLVLAPVLAGALGLYDDVHPDTAMLRMLGTMFPFGLAAVVAMVAHENGNRKARLGLDHHR